MQRPPHLPCTRCSRPPHTPTPPLVPPPHPPPFKQLVAIHDSARPLVTAADTLLCLRDAWEVRSPPPPLPLLRCLPACLRAALACLPLPACLRAALACLPLPACLVELPRCPTALLVSSAQLARCSPCLPRLAPSLPTPASFAAAGRSRRPGCAGEAHHQGSGWRWNGCQDAEACCLVGGADAAGERGGGGGGGAAGAGGGGRAAAHLAGVLSRPACLCPPLRRSVAVGSAERQPPQTLVRQLLQPAYLCFCRSSGRRCCGKALSWWHARG